MAAVLAEPLGNPTGSHPAGQRARRLLEEARDEVAGALGRPPADIVFTSGGTESANLAVLGPIEAARLAGRRRPSSSGPPSSTPRSARRAVPLARSAPTPASSRWTAPACSTSTHWCAPSSRDHARGGDDRQQRDRRAAARARGGRGRAPARPARRRLHRRRPGGRPSSTSRHVRRSRPGVARRAHKLGGPVGTGALAVRAGVHLTARQHGGGQERERRSGTQDVVGAVGLAAALRPPRPSGTGPQWWPTGATAWPSGCSTRCPRPNEPCRPDRRPARTPASLHRRRRARGAPRGARPQGLCASGGSSCASGALEPSPVLAAMGVPADLAGGAIRFSLGTRTTDEDVERALADRPGRRRRARVRA